MTSSVPHSWSNSRRCHRYSETAPGPRPQWPLRPRSCTPTFDTWLLAQSSVLRQCCDRCHRRSIPMLFLRLGDTCHYRGARGSQARAGIRASQRGPAPVDANHHPTVDLAGLRRRQTVGCSGTNAARRKIANSHGPFAWSPGRCCRSLCFCAGKSIWKGESIPT